MWWKSGRLIINTDQYQPFCFQDYLDKMYHLVPSIPTRLIVSTGLDRVKMKNLKDYWVPFPFRSKKTCALRYWSHPWVSDDSINGGTHGVFSLPLFPCPSSPIWDILNVCTDTLLLESCNISGMIVYHWYMYSQNIKLKNIILCNFFLSPWLYITSCTMIKEYVIICTNKFSYFYSNKRKG